MALTSYSDPDVAVVEWESWPARVRTDVESRSWVTRIALVHPETTRQFVSIMYLQFLLRIIQTFTTRETG